METRRRSLVKALLWSALGWTVMTLVGLGFTGSVTIGGAIAALNTVLGLVTYVIYERIWACIAWGRL